MPEPLLTMKNVAARAGLSAHVIRVWERRYRAIEPQRSDTNRRLYSSADVEKLKLLHAATQAGHSIGQIAQLSVKDLRRLANSEAPPKTAAVKKRANAPAIAELIGSAVENVSALDARGFADSLERAAVALGSPAVLHQVIAPLAIRIGDLWRKGEMSIAHEHFATSAIAEFLAHFAPAHSTTASAPLMLVATPTGQLHELGAWIVTAAARTHGWRASYMGASLPVEELISAVQTMHPRAVALSVVFPPNDAQLERDAVKLGKLLPAGCSLIVGGRSAAGYSTTWRETGATLLSSLEDLYPTLDRLTAKARR